MGIQRYSSGSSWEGVVGYSRAVRVGSLIEVAGTVAVDDDGKVVGKGSAYQQASFILSKIVRYVEKAGGRAEDVVRTRIFLTDISKWEEVGRAHGEVFKDIRPVATMVEVRRLISPNYLVEIEATAVIEKEG